MDNARLPLAKADPVARTVNIEGLADLKRIVAARVAMMAPEARKVIAEDRVPRCLSSSHWT